MCYLINIHLEDTGHNTPYKVKCFPRRTYGKTCLKISSSQDTGWEGAGAQFRSFLRRTYAKYALSSGKNTRAGFNS